MITRDGICGVLRAGLRPGRDPSRGFPRTAAEVVAALGYGDFSTGAGYLLDESSGTLAAAFGSPNLTVGFGSPLYGFAGLRGGADKAVSHTEGAAAYWTGGNVYNIAAASDFLMVWGGICAAAPSVTRSVINKRGAGAGWWMTQDPSTGFLFRTNTQNGSGTNNLLIGEPHFGIAAISRAVTGMRTGIRGVHTGRTFLSSVTTIAATDETNADQLQLGSGVGLGASPVRLFCLYIVSGADVATGVTANASVALQNFAAAVMP